VFFTRLEICFQGWKFAFRAGNSALGAEFPPLDKYSGGQKFLNFRPFEIRLSPLQNIVVQHSVKGPEILVWQNFWPSKIRLSPLQKAVVQLSGRGPEILRNQNFRGPEIPLRIFAKSFLSSYGATFCKGPEFLAGIF
jgi:hypothetical protein